MSLLLRFLRIARQALLTALALLASLTAASPAAAEAQRDLTDIVLFAANNSATGAPTIDGAARVGQTLTADTSAIVDDDGLDDVEYSYQWIRGESSNAADIEEATNSTYLLVPEDQDKAIRVRVTFTDDLSNPESLVSDATDHVVAAPTTQVKNTGQSAPSSWPLSASLTGLGQAFTTGSNPGGYVLSSIGISLQTSDSSGAASSTTVTLNPTDDDGKPGDALCTLDDPDTFTTSTGLTFIVHTFTAPTTGDNLCPTLAADTTYAVLVLRAADATTNVRLPKTNSTAEDTLDPGTGWTIADSRLNRRISTVDGQPQSDPTWSTNTGLHLIEVEASPAVHPAIAQGITTLVSNYGQSRHTQPAGFSTAANGEGRRAQKFKTGPTGRYALDSIAVPVWMTTFQQWINHRLVPSTELISVTLNAGGSNPGDALCTLINPAIFRDVYSDVFTAPSTGPGACPTLSASTEYFVVIRWNYWTNPPRIFRASSTAEDEPDTGWRIDNNGRSWNGNWYMSNDDVYGDRGLPIFLEVTGAVVHVNTPGAPTISGIAQVDRKLTALTATITDSDGLDGVTFDYQWIRVDGASETDIDGATSRKYTLTGDDQGKRVKVKVSYIDNANNNDSVTSDPTETVIPRANSAATGKPAISGPASVGQELTADTSNISDDNGLDDVTFNYQWLHADGTEIGTDSSTYTIAPADKGKTIRVRVTFTDDGGYAESVTSAATETVVAPNSDATGAPTISGTEQVGETLTASTANIDDSNGLDGVTFNYQWIRVDGGDGTEADIDGATNSTYILDPADKDEKIKVKVSFIDNDGYDESVTSEATETINTPPNSDATGQPTISGTKTVGHTLTASTAAIDDTNGLDGVTFRYQWIRVDGDDAAAISGATNSTYTLAPADRGKKIKVNVSFIDNAGHAESVTSVATDAIAVPPNSDATGKPQISGLRVVGETLTADISGIVDSNGLTGVTFNYQWIRVDGADGTEADIGANSSTYILDPADRGHKIRIKASFIDNDGYDESVTSITTSTIRRAQVTATSAPTIDGTAQVGEELTADPSDIDDTNGLTGVTFNYQWIRVDGGDGTEADIGTNSSTYTVAPADEGHTIKVTVSFNDQDSYAESLTSATTETVVAAAATNTAPTGLPTIEGTPRVHESLKADIDGINDGDGLGTGSDDSYQWIRVDSGVDADISGATSEHYTLTDNDLGKEIKVRFSFTDGGGTTEELVSAAYDVIAGPIEVMVATSPATDPPALTVAEGGTGTYTVKLTDRPSKTVTVTVTAGGDVTTQPASLRFFPDAWNTAQTVTVSAGHDTDLADDTVTLTHAATRADIPNYAITIDGVAVTVTDDDTAGVTVSTSALTVGEGSGSGTYTVVLNQAPSDTVTVTVGDGGDVTATPETLTFTTGTWSTAQTVTVRAGQDNDLADDTVTLTHSASSNDNDYDGVTIAGVSVTVTDDDAAAVTVSKSTLTVGEGSGSGAYTVVLDFQPSHTVTIDVTTGGDVTANPARLTFATNTWDDAQTVTVTAGQDDDLTDDTVTLTHTADSNDNNYDNITVGSVEVTVTDDDTAGATVSKSALTVGEGSGSGTYTVVLNQAPSDTVTVTVGDGGDVTATPETLTFTTGTWSTAQTVTVRAGQDNDLADDTVTLTHSASSNDNDYDGVTIAGVSVTVTDDDAAAVTVSKSTLTVGEGSGSGAYTVVLDFQPSHTVTIDVTTGGDVTANPARLTFATNTWDDAQTVTVTAGHDNDLTDDTVTLTHTADSNDNNYDNITVGSVEVTVTDDDTAGATVSKSALTVGEGSGSGTYTVVLNQAPSDTVTVTVGDGGDVTATPETLTFTTGTWSTAQTVTVRAGQDNDLADDTVTLTHSASSNDNDYDGVTIAGVSVTVTDDDAAAVTVSKSTLTVGEGSGSGAYTVVLDFQPSHTVTIDVTTGGDVTANPARLTFATNTWDDAQTVTVTAGHDNDLTDDTVTLTHTADSNDNNYDNITVGSVEVTVTDDDTAGATVSKSTLTVGEGGTGTYTVVLDFQPADTVTIDVTSRGDVTVEPASLTFTVNDWDSAQTVTVRAGHDTDLADDTVTLTHRADSNDNDYDGVGIGSVSVTVTDDDEPAATVSTSVLTVTEGASDTYTVELDFQPSASVTIDVTAGGDVTVQPDSLTFTINDWDLARTVSVRAGEDNDTANDAVTLTHSVAADSAAEYAGVSIGSVSVTVDDDDTAGVTVSESALTVGEGSTGTYTVRLDFQPSADVTVAVGAGGDVTAEPETLTFSTDTWDTAQTVTVRAGQDDDLANDTVPLTHTATSDDSDYDGATIAGVDVTVTDDDTAAAMVSESALTVGEGSTGTYTVKLRYQPSDTVTITVGAGGDVTAEPTSLTFTTDTWDTAQTVTVRAGHDDDTANDTVPLTHTAASPGSDYHGVAIAGVDVTVTDDDEPAATVSTSVLTVDEGSTGTYTVVLDYQPAHTVTIDVTARGDVTADPETLTFSTDTWDNAQTVVVSAGHDTDLADDTVMLTHTATSFDIDFNAISIGSVDVTVTDDDTAAVTVSDALLTVGEGGTGTYTVVLDFQPADTVTIDITARGDVTTNPARLTFTTADWDSAQTVTVTAGHDTDLADDTVTLTHRATSDDSDYNGAGIGSVSVAVTDDDEPAATVSTSVLTVTEGASDTYTVELDFQPTADVTITVGDGGDVTAHPSSLTFTVNDWNLARTVTVRAGEDTDTADDTVTLTHSVAAASATEYTGVSIGSVAVTVTDIDTPSAAVTPSTLTVAEGSTGTYTVKLNYQPTADVTITVGDGGDVTVEPARLTFTTVDWSSAQTVTVTAGQDDDTINDAVTLTHSVAAASAVEYIGVSIGGAAVTVTDNDIPAVTVSESTLTVGEGSTGTYTVKLDYQPSASVTIDITSRGDVTVEHARLTFTTVDWSSAQTVTVTAGQDDDTINDAVTLTHSVAADSAAEYTGVGIGSVRVTVNDDDSAGATVSPSTLTVAEGSTGTYTVKLNYQPSATVTVAISAGGDVTVSPDRLTFTTGDWDSQTVVVTAGHDMDLADDAVTLTHSVAADSAAEYTGVGIGSVGVTVNDDDTAAVRVSTRALTVEEGSTGTYTVKLDYQPSVTVTIDVTAGGDVTTNPASLTFTTSTWDTAQTVTVRADADDDTIDDAVMLTHTVATVSAAEYMSTSIGSVEVTVIEGGVGTTGVTGITGGTTGGGGSGGGGGVGPEPGPGPGPESEGPAGFVDVDANSAHGAAIDALFAAGITAGCSTEPLRYCPSRAVTRAQMATFLVRALDLPAPEGPAGFVDVDANSAHGAAIDALFAAGITAGCSTEPLRYCPSRAVTRAQMATFLVRALDLPAPEGPAGFVDVDANSAHGAAIDALFAAGITAGCSTEPLRYCPSRAVTRAQMATFLTRALELAAPDQPAVFTDVARTWGSSASR